MSRTLLTVSIIFFLGANALHAQMGSVNDYKNGGTRFDAEKYKSDRDIQEMKQSQQYKPNNSSTTPNYGNIKPYRDREEERREMRQNMSGPKPEFATFEGTGKAELRDGVYEGTFKYGQLVGKGKLTYNNGDVYEGDFKDGKPNGYGVLKETDGTIHAGAFVNGNKNGYATVTYPDGRKYEGGWLNYDRDGDGVEYNSSGTVIKKGRWINGVFTPAKYDERFPPTQAATQIMPAFTLQDFQKPKGKDVPKEGFETYQFANGDRFKGRWIKSKIDNGIYIWANGDTCKGSIGDIKELAYLDFCLKSGVIINKQFTKGKMSNSVVCKFRNGEFLSIDDLAAYSYDKLSKVFYHFANGDSYMGNMLNGKCEGKGYYTFANGWSYDGNFINGKRQDKDGYLSYKNDKYPSMHGKFENDELVPGSTYTDASLIKPVDPHAPDMYDGH